MCPASAISASEPETRPPATSTSMKPPVSSAAMPIARALRLAWWRGMVMVVAVVVVAHRRAIASATRAVKSCGSRTAATSAASTVTPQRSAIAA